MEDNQATSPGLVGSFRRLAETLLRTLQNRVELFALELKEEKIRLLDALLWAGAAIFFAAFALMMITFTCIALSSDAARPYVMVGFCVLYLALAVVSVLSLRKRMQGPPPLQDTVAELKKDVACLTSRQSR